MEVFVSYFQENFVQKNTQIMSTTILNIINKCLNQFVDKDILNQPNNSKSVTNGLKNDLSNLMSKLNEHVISNFELFTEACFIFLFFLGFSFHKMY